MITSNCSYSYKIFAQQITSPMISQQEKKMREGWELKDKVFCPRPPANRLLLAFPLQEQPKKQARSFSTSSIILYCYEIHQLDKIRQKYNFTVAGHVNPENQFNFEKRGPCTPDQCYGDAFGVLRPTTVYKRKKLIKAKANK